MGIRYTIFRRQFFIGRHVISAGEHWNSHPMQSGLVLSYCESLPVIILYDELQNEWILLGDAIQAGRDLPAPETCIRNLGANEDVSEHYYSWAGRWLLIGRNEVHADASALLGCYYKTRNGEVELSSTPYFLSGTEIPESYILRKGVGIECYPLPGSGFSKINKVLPTQVLDLATGQCKPRNLFKSVRRSTHEKILHELIDVLTTAVVNGSNYFKKNMTLALTAGYDSRLLMAILKSANLSFDAITFDVPQLAPCDRNLPGPIAAASSIDYEFLHRKQLNRENYNKYNIHSCYHAVERDREIMMYQQFDGLDKESVLIRGGCFEMASSPYNRYLPAERLTGEQIVRLLKGNKWQAEALNKWLRWVDQHPIEQLDWRDRYYLEQRLAGWLSSTEQALDLVNIDRFVPANSALFFNLLLQLPFAMRETKSHQVEMIRLLAPELLDFPFNPPSSHLVKKYRRLLFKMEKLTQPKKLPVTRTDSVTIITRRIKDEVGSNTYQD